MPAFELRRLINVDDILKSLQSYILLIWFNYDYDIDR